MDLYFRLCIIWIPMVGAQYRLDEILTEKTTWCKNNYYNWPECRDTPGGYTCNCGPGFYWNTKTCISDAVDSRLEFPEPQLPKNGSDQKPAFAYTILLNKPFPLLDAFTMSFYMKPSVRSGRGSNKQCIFSYKYFIKDKQHIFSLCIAKFLEITIHNQTAKANLARAAFSTDRWSHLVVNWVSRTGEIEVYFDKQKIALRGGVVSLGTGQPVESNGHMVLGQDSPYSDGHYNLDLAYRGSLAHVNIWKQKLDKNQTDNLHNDCTFTHCGDGVEWVDLREGTRGISRLRWPSGIENTNHRCFSNNDALVTCDKYCSFIIGVQCKEEIQESVMWVRTPVPRDKQSALLELPCPGYDLTDNTTEILMANRTCQAGADGVGIWAKAQMDNCLSRSSLAFSRKVRSYIRNTFDKAYVLALLSDLRNQTKARTYDNPVDLSSTITSISDLMNSQLDEIEKLMKEKRQSEVSTFSLGTYTSSKGLSYAESIQLIDLYMTITNELIDERQDIAWNKTLPLGQEADELLQFIDRLTYLIALSLKYHILSQEAVEPMYRKVFEHIALKVEAVRAADFRGTIFPDPADVEALEMTSEPARVSYLPSYPRSDIPKDIKPDYVCISSIQLNTFRRLLHDPLRFGLEDNINTPVVAVRIHESLNSENQLTISNSSNVKLTLYFGDTRNISNPECVALVHGDSSANRRWDRSFTACSVNLNDTKYVECQCIGQGFYAGTTDMYNVNWETPPPPPVLMTLPSYLGCTISLFLCICTLAMLIYVGTASRTATMHKHFAVAVIGNTTAFMIGITLTFNETACKSFAILFHFFFLSMYAWLMNEGFNVYISITYTAHNQSTQENSGHWRYYIIGWGVPGVLVSAIVGSSFDTYFSDKMCWVSMDKFWLFSGPPIAMIAVTLLVMTFAAKENNEVSYTKNESANTMTEYHANAVWTQLILVSCTWAMAFLSLNFHTIVFKWVFFIFNSAQGAFLFVFFFLLNEEVRSVIKNKDIKKQLGWDVSTGNIGATTPNGAPEDTIPLNPTERERALYRQAAGSVDMAESSHPLLSNQESTNHSDSRFAEDLADEDPADDYVISVSRLREIELDTLTETSV